jgi:F420-dependent oxidoreductase-like protein
MKVGVLIEPRLPGSVEFALAAEDLGVDSLWVPEVWGYDALTGLAFLAARTTRIGLGTFVVQLGSRSPALLATSALSLQELSGGRFVLGVGTSGPRVMEGWHGVRFHRPVQATRETVEIIRTVSCAERLEHRGEIYPLPLPDSRGAALVPMVRPGEVPVYIAAMGPQNLRLTGEVADGWLGNAFIPEAADVFLDPIAEGAHRAGRKVSDLDLVAPVAVEFTRDPAEGTAAARRHADGYAFTIGAMGSGQGQQARNFYNDAFTRLGYGSEVAEVARLWHDGERDRARAAVPLDLGALTNLIGTPDVIAERVHRYELAGITTLLAKIDGSYGEQLPVLQQLLSAMGRL